MAWQLTGEALEQLLSLLDADPERGAHAYERLRRRTIGLLQWWGAPEADSLADQVFDRVARKLQEGAVIAEGSVGAYVRGVARMVFYESTRHASVPLAAREPVVVPADPDPAETAHVCLERCLGTLARDDRDLVLRYYGDGTRPDVRRQLAADLGVSSTTLRVRTHRLRERLEGCVTSCVGR